MLTPERLLSARRLGYVFGGGSARCAFQIGVIETLAALGAKPAVCFGVSAGSWNAAIVAAGITPRIRYYWRSFLRMPHVELRNLFRPDHSPFRFRELHRRTFDRFIGDRLHAPGALPLFVSLTRLRDREGVILRAQDVDDIFELLLATNFLLPFYTHAPVVGGEAYGDGGICDNAPYERAFAEGCDAVVLVSMKGESEGGLFKNRHDLDHVIPPEYAERMLVVRPRHRLPISFTERSWPPLERLARIGALRTRELLYGEEHPETQIRARGEAPSAKVTRAVRALKRLTAPFGDGADAQRPLVR